VKYYAALSAISLSVNRHPRLTSRSPPHTRGVPDKYNVELIGAFWAGKNMN
jgi:hypothetical protein